MALEDGKYDPESAPGGLEASKNRIARRRAQKNVEKWGQQAPGELAAALTEELGELLEEILAPQTGENVWEMNTEEFNLYTTLREARDASLRVQDGLDDAASPGDPLFIPEREDMDVQEVREELYDLMALCYQLDWALYQGVRADAE